MVKGPLQTVKQCQAPWSSKRVEPSHPENDVGECQSRESWLLTLTVRFLPKTATTTGSNFARTAAYCFNRYPVLNTQAMLARHAAMIATITATLDHTGTSATPKNVHRKPLTR